MRQIEINLYDRGRRSGFFKNLRAGLFPWVFHWFFRVAGAIFNDSTVVACLLMTVVLGGIASIAGKDYVIQQQELAGIATNRAVYYDSEHWVYKYKLEDVARLIAEEVTTGIEINNYNGPIIARSQEKQALSNLRHYNCIRPTEWTGNGLKLLWTRSEKYGMKHT